MTVGMRKGENRAVGRSKTGEAEGEAALPIEMEDEKALVVTILFRNCGM